jgi:heme/copper-type cytochrome/quinol oxidase subunit 2
MTNILRFCRTLAMVTLAMVALATIAVGGAALALAQDHAAQSSVTQTGAAQVHVIEVLADSDSRYKIAGERTPEITVQAGEQVLLRVTARRGRTWNRDGSIHGFSLLRTKDRTKVEGWDLLFKPGKQEFQLTAPTEAGEYEVVCTVICSEDHEGMHMKFTVRP